MAAGIREIIHVKSSKEINLLSAMFDKGFVEEVECFEVGWLKRTGWVCREEGEEAVPGWEQ